MHSCLLPRPVVNDILKLAQSVPDKEICGLISIDETKAMKVIPVKNIASSPDRFFEMDPTDTIRAMKSIRESNASLFAIFHSHPHSPAFPSKTDIEQAGYPEALYLIVSLDTKGVLELKGFKINNNEVVGVDLVI